MSFVKYAIIALSVLLTGCGSVADDLYPVSTDKRPSVQAGEVGPLVGQTAPDFTTFDSLSNTVNLSAELSELGTEAIVLYFAMWCPVCNSHMDHMLQNIVPFFPDVKFFIIDYVSGSVKDVRSNEIANGYANSLFTVLADLDNSKLKSYDATMGTTVVIDSSGVIRMNEDYKDGTRLREVLEDVP